MSEKIIVGTRGSKLALAQTEKVVQLLKKKGYDVEIKIIKTSGDVLKDKPLHEFKGVGAFVQTIDRALSEGKIDLAVHSYKDVPSKILGVIPAVLKRESPCDCIVFNKSDIKVVGTSSLRRIAQIKRYMPGVEIKNLRGNIDTRLKKLEEGMYDAIVLAEAGLIRLGIDVKRKTLNPEKFVPSANQGIIAIETRKGEEWLVEELNDKDTFLEACVERAVLETLEIGCAVPAGIYAKKVGNSVKLIAHIYSTKSDSENKDLRFEALIKSDDFDDASREAREIAKNYREGCSKIMSCR